jgi:hypothetical protein
MHIFLQNLPSMNILDPIFYRTLFYDIRQWSPRGDTSEVYFCSNVPVSDVDLTIEL